MTIVRSRALDGPAAAIANQEVERARRAWEERVAAARQEGLRQGRVEAETALAERQRRLEEREARLAHDLKEGRRAVEAEYQARWRESLAAVRKGVEALAGAERRWVSEAGEAAIVGLAVAMAGRILRHEVLAGGPWMDAIVRETLAQVPERREVALRMHPLDAAVVRERGAEYAAPGGLALRVLDDDTVGRGSCEVEWEGTVIDAGVASTWERLSDLLLGRARAAPSSGDEGGAS